MRKEIIFFLSIALLFSGCSQMLYEFSDHPGYIANVSNINTGKDENRINAAVFPAANHSEVQVNYNVNSKYGVQFNLYKGYHNRFTLNEGALSYGSSLSNSTDASISAGYGYGSLVFSDMREWYPMKTSYSYQKFYGMKSYMHKFFIQPALVFKTAPMRKFILSARLSGLYFPRYYYYLREVKSSGWSFYPVRNDSISVNNKFSLVLDPACTFKREGEHFGGFLQCQFSIPLTETDKINKHHLINNFWPLVSLGLTIKIRKFGFRNALKEVFRKRESNRQTK